MGESERKIGGGGVNGRGGKRKRWRKGNRCNGCLAYYFSLLVYQWLPCQQDSYQCQLPHEHCYIHHLCSPLDQGQ